jgi:hypothetical protein
LTPLQIQADALLLPIIAIVLLVAVLIGAIMFALRRTRTMSDELSKEAKAKFDAIKPPSVQTRQLDVKQGSSVSAVRPFDRSGSLTAMTELQETKNRLQQISRDSATLREKEVAMRNELGSLRIEVRLLREQVVGGMREIQTLKDTVQEQSDKLQDQLRNLEQQIKEIKDHEEHAETTAPAAPSGTPSQSGFLNTLFRRKTCFSCGRRLRIQDRFCDSCGRQVTQV